MIRRSTIGGILFVLILSASGSQPARAQESPIPAEAVEFYESGREHYRAGRYRQAAVDLERALELDPDSSMLVYNLARVYELLGEIDRATEYYQRYLSRLPGNDPERAQVQRTLERLDGASEVTPSTLGPSRGRADTAFYVTLSVGGALLLAGGTMAGLALSKDAEGNTFVLGVDGTAEQRESAQEEARRSAIAADSLLAAGGAAVGIALLLYLLRDEEVEAGLSAGVGRSSAGTPMLMLRGEL